MRSHFEWSLEEILSFNSHFQKDFTLIQLQPRGREPKTPRFSQQSVEGRNEPKGKVQSQETKGKKKPSEADFVNSYMNTSDFSQLLLGPDLTHHISQN